MEEKKEKKVCADVGHVSLINLSAALLLMMHQWPEMLRLPLTSRATLLLVWGSQAARVMGERLRGCVRKTELGFNAG